MRSPYHDTGQLLEHGNHSFMKRTPVVCLLATVPWFRVSTRSERGRGSHRGIGGQRRTRCVCSPTVNGIRNALATDWNEYCDTHRLKLFP